MSEQHSQPKNGRHLDRCFAAAAVKITPGGFHAAAAPTPITTLLGSCVSVCLYDRERGIGGMNHFMLPQGSSPPCPGDCSGHCPDACAGRYGGCAIKRLLLRLEQLGARRFLLEAKVFGAGTMFPGTADIGRMNAAFALAQLRGAGIPVLASDLGGCSPRRVVFFPATGRVFVKRLSGAGRLRLRQNQAPVGPEEPGSKALSPGPTRKPP